MYYLLHVSVNHEMKDLFESRKDISIEFLSKTTKWVQ